MRILIDGQTLSTPEANRGIGVATRRIIEHLVSAEFAHDWLISVRHDSDTECFAPSIRQRLKAICVDTTFAGDDASWPTDEVSDAIQRIVRREKVDLFWTPNPLMNNVVLPTGLRDVPVVATIYDLIPLVMKDVYLDRWGSRLRQEYLRRLRALPKWADRLVFISHSARNDYVQFAPEVAEKSTVVHLAVDHAQYRPRLAPADCDAERYVLTVGGFDPRKNMNAALEAFAQLTQREPFVRQALKFYVVCECSDQSRDAYQRLAQRLGVSDRLVLKGYVPDDELVEMCRRCAAFFFPSRYEGFGLPVLEAMACGVPVVTTRVSSIPEIAGETAFYCPTDDPSRMADALAEALNPQSQDVARRRTQITQARQFTWSKTAAAYAGLFRDMSGARPASVTHHRPRVAYVSPWPPQRSGIADYSRALVGELKSRADITLFLPEPAAATDCFGLPVEPLSALPDAVGEFDTAIYHIGNNTQFHRDIYRLAWQHPGIVVLHDYNIHPFLKDAFVDTPEESLFYDALEQSHRLGRDQYRVAGDNVFDYPMSQALVRRSQATIVHSRWVRDQFSDSDNVFVAPLGGDTSQPQATSEQIEELRRRFDLSAECFVVATLGFVNPLKRIPSMLEAIRIVLDHGYPVRFVIGGAADAEQAVRRKIESLGLKEHAIVTGYLREEEYDALVQLSDVVLNLRCPSMGESSASLMRALGRNKAVITSHFQQFAEFPDAVCWKADVNEQEVPQLVAYIEHLLRNPHVRRQMERNAGLFVKQYASQAIAADAYAAVIHRVTARRPIELGSSNKPAPMGDVSDGHRAA